MDHLLNLDEEFDLADAAAAALEVVTRPDVRVLREMVANPRRNLPHVFDHPEIERAPPHEGLDGLEKTPPERAVTGGGTGTDERRPLPRQSGGFVMRDRGLERKRDRGNFGRWPKPQIDPLDIAVGGALLEQFDHPPADPHRCLAGILAVAFGQGSRIEQQGEVDVGGIIELAAAKLAHGDHRKALRFGTGNAFGDRRGKGLVDRRVGKVRQ